MITSLDTYQENALKIIEQNDITFISGNKYSGKSHLLRYLIRNKWMEGKNILIVAGSTEQAVLIQKLLGIYDLSKYSLIFNNSDEFDKKNTAKIRSLVEEARIEISRHDINSINLIQQSILNRISEYYRNLNQSLIQGKSLSELLIISAFDTNSYTNIHFNQIFDSGKFDFSEIEFADLSKNVKTAFELNLGGENKNDAYFAKKSYVEKNPDKAWNHIADWLENSRIKILKSIELLGVFLNRQVNTIFETEWKELKQDLTLAETCMLDCKTFLIQYQDFEPKSSIFGIDKKTKALNDNYQLSKQKIIYDYKKLIQKLEGNQKIKDNFSIPDQQCDKIEQIKTNIEKIINNSQKFEDILYNSIQIEIKSINFRNIRNSNTEILQSELKSLFSLLNDGYAIKKWEDTAFSINKQLRYLESILEELNEIEGQRLNFFNNYKWNSFLWSLDEKSLYIIKKLNIYRPKNWLVFLKNWYIQNIILANQKKVITDIKPAFKEYENVCHKKEELARLKSAKIWQNKRDIYLNKIEDQKNSTLKKILNQADVNISEQELMESEDDFLHTVMPVIIVVQDVMEKNNRHLKDKFDCIVFANFGDYKDRAEKLIPEGFTGKMVFVSEEENITDNLKNALWSHSYQIGIQHAELKGNHQQGMIELIDMNNTERLYAARNLAFMLQSTNPNIKIFHLKNKIILSALDEVLNKVILKILENQGIKEMKIIDTPFHLLVDSILEVNNRQVLITQNHLIDYRSTENLDWQLFILSKIEKSGIRIINFNTTDIITEPVKSVKEFISRI